MIFIQVLGGIVLLLVVVILVALLWIRRKIRNVVSEAAKLAPYSVPIQGRIRLSASAEDGAAWFAEERHQAYRRWQRKLTAAGFEPLGGFEESESGRFLWVAHQENRSFAMVTSLGEKIILEYCALGASGRAFLRTPNPVFPEVQSDSLSIHPKKQLAPAEGLAWLGEQGALKALSVRQFVLFYERVYAACMDIRLSNPACEAMLHDWIEFAGLEALGDEELAEAVGICRDQCVTASYQAIRDHARTALKLDSDAWSRIEDNLLIIHNKTGFEEIMSAFATDLAEELIEQCKASGMAVAKTFDAVNRRLEAQDQFALLAEVSKPIASRVYLRRIALESVDLQGDDLKPGPGLKRFLYQAKDEQDALVASSIIAAKVSDARAQLQRRGYSDIKILSANHDLVQIDDSEMERMAAGLVEAQSDAMPRALLKIILGNWILWTPFALWALWALFDGPPFGISDYLAFALALLSLGGACYLALPTLFYHASQEALAWGRVESALRYFRVVRKLGAPGIKKTVLNAEEAKLLAYQGAKEQALRLLEGQRDLLTRIEYLGFLAQLYDAARDYPKMIETHAKLVEEAPDNQEFRVDLAMSLLRYAQRTQQAAELIQPIHPHECSELFASGLLYAQGLVAGQQGESRRAIHKLHEAFQGFSAFKNPLVYAIQAEICGYMAAYLHQQGDHQQAEKVWKQVRPRLEALQAEHVLKVYQEAMGQRGD